jgi:hypothetical protein
MRVKTTRDVVILVVFLLSLFGGINAQDCTEENVTVWEGEAISPGGIRNTFIGKCAGKSNIEGQNNTFLGWRAGIANKKGSHNTFLGFRAGKSNLTGGANIFVGYDAGSSNTEGGANIFIGLRAGFNNTKGRGNTFLGYEAGNGNIDGQGNIYIGHHAGFENEKGDHNIFIGNLTGNSNKGNHNTFLGYGSGYENKTGSGNVFIGFKAGHSEVRSNKLHIANGPTNSDTLIYGDFEKKRVGINKTNPTYTLDVNGEIIADKCHERSDIRLKTDVNPLNSALEQIALLRGVTFHWKDKKKDNGQQMGVIAQEIEKVFPQVVSTDGSGYKSVAYSSLVAPLIEAVKELKSENETLKARLEALEKMIKD